jgi:Leu/Phe-tRNA-protein transferase
MTNGFPSNVLLPDQQQIVEGLRECLREEKYQNVVLTEEEFWTIVEKTAADLSHDLYEYVQTIWLLYQALGNRYYAHGPAVSRVMNLGGGGVVLNDETITPDAIAKRIVEYYYYCLRSIYSKLFANADGYKIEDRNGYTWSGGFTGVCLSVEYEISKITHEDKSSLNYQLWYTFSVSERKQNTYREKAWKY